MRAHTLAICILAGRTANDKGPPLGSSEDGRGDAAKAALAEAERPRPSIAQQRGTMSNVRTSPRRQEEIRPSVHVTCPGPVDSRTFGTAKRELGDIWLGSWKGGEATRIQQTS